MSTLESVGSEKLNVWISAEDKRLIERAASIVGQSLDDFVKSAVLSSARDHIREDAVIRLTEQGWNQLADYLESPDDGPNEALLRAAERNSDVRPVAAARSA